MMTAVARTYQVVAIALAVASLPAMSLPCMENPLPHTCCKAHMRSAGQQTATAHRHVADCCKQMGECAVVRNLITFTSSLEAPLALAGTLPHAFLGALPTLEGIQRAAPTILPHAPPTYLRNRTLLI